MTRRQQDIAGASLFFCSLLALAFASLASAQSVSGTIAGTVRDASSLAVSGAAITLTDTSTALERNETSNEQGDFIFSSVPPGSYQLVIKFQGFKTLQRDDVQLTASERLSLGTLVLAVGSAEQKIEVTAQGTAVQTESSEHSAVLTAAQLQNLMVRGRNVTSMVKVLPGVVDTAEGTSGQASGNSNSEEQISKFFYFNVQGNRSNATNITLDGVALNEPGGNTQVNVAVGLDAIAEVKVLLSNYQAEYGRMSGANIELVAKSGTRDFHGGGSYYKRHEQFNANGFFNNRLGLPKPYYRFNVWNYNIGGPVYIPGHFNKERNKLFFFWTQEFWPLRITNPLKQVTMPTALERAGDFSQSRDQNGALIPIKDPQTGAQFPGNIIPANRINSNGQALLNIFPQPNFLNRSVSAGLYNYNSQIPADTPNRVDTFKTDYNISSNDLLSFTWSAHYRREEGYASRSSVNWPMNSTRIQSRSLFYAWRYQHVFSPTTVNELTVGQNQHHGYDTVDPDQQALISRSGRGINLPQFYPAGNPLNLIPSLTFGGIPNAATVAFGSTYPINNARKIFNAADNLSKTVGAHTVKAGIVIEHLWIDEGPTASNFNGIFDFSRDVNNPLDSGYAFANALLGNFTSYQEASARPSPKLRNNSVEWYLQDTWRANRKLTLDYGVRFYWNQPYYEESGLVSGFVPALYDSTQAVSLVRPGIVNGRRVGINPVNGAVLPSATIGAIAPGSGNATDGIVVAANSSSYPQGLQNNPGVKLGPRFGFAYDPFGDGKTAIRGGFGIFYNSLPSGSGIGVMDAQYPIVASPVISYGSLATYSGASGLVFPQSVIGLNPNNTIPRVMDINLSVQRSLGYGTVIDVSYIGTLGRHLLWQRNINPVPVGADFQPANADPTNPKVPLTSNFLRPVIGYGNLGILETASSSNYHSLQVSVNRRFARGLQFGANWTWSKTMDFNDNDTDNIGVLAPLRSWNYGLASFDRTHDLKINFLYELPRSRIPWAPAKFIVDGWQTSGIASFVSGAPTTVTFTTTNGVDLTGTASQTPRVNVTGSVYLPSDQRTFYKNFRTDVFQLPAVGTLGNAGRTLLRGPGINNWDLSLFKNFRVKDRASIQFRWELYNAFNHTQFSALDTAARFDASGRQVNADLGAFTAARNPRIMQFALRVTF